MIFTILKTKTRPITLKSNKSFMGCKFSFPYVDTYSDVPKSKFVLENSNLNVGCVPAYFCGGQKNNLLL